jgi:crossover junction endodeoxyribonuclease RuvC
MSALRILGIDPGTVRCGWAVIDKAGNRLAHVESGVIQPPVKAPMAQRLMHIHRELSEVIGRNGPTECAIESVFYGLNAQTAIKLGQARGSAMVAAAGMGLDVFEYEASLVKQRATGRGNASKEQVRSMVALMFRLSDDMILDRSDALAIAVCHAQQHPLLRTGT